MNEIQKYFSEKRATLAKHHLFNQQLDNEKEKKIALFSANLDKYTNQFEELAIKAKVLNNIQQNVNEDYDDRQETEMTRIYVSCFKCKFDEETLMKHFGQYGKISDLFVPVHNDGSTRGFAFITYEKVYKHPCEEKHVINGCELLIGRDIPPSSEEKTPVLMLTGTLQNIPSYTLQGHFNQYGRIIEIIRKFDYETKIFSRYAFIVFSTSDSVEKAMKKQSQVIGGQLIHLRKAINFEIFGQVVTEKAVTSFALDKNLVAKYRIIPITTLTLDVLKAYFSNYGRVLDYYIPKIYGSDENKDYAYVTLARSPNKPFIKQGWHKIANKEVRIEMEIPFNGKTKSNCLIISASPKLISRISTTDIRNHFKRYGKIKDIRKPTDTFKKTILHCAFVEFKESSSVDEAIKTPVCIINNLPFSVSKSVHEQYKK